MEWRCEWCGKPHEENDPPCDNCGHGTFEKAVVQEPAAGPARETTVVWVCTECGREHPKHAPPCSRCGNPTLERREITVEDADLTAPSYRDLLTPGYVAGIVLALALGVVLLLGLAGVVTLPGMGQDVPAVSDVPGNATSLDGTALADVEIAYLERANAIRASANLTSLTRNDRLDAVATYYNQRRVKAALGDGSVPSNDELRDLLGGTCDRGARFVEYFVPVPPSVSDPDVIGERLADRAFETGQGGLPAERGLTGLDTHALPNGSLSVTQFAC